jgi:hypothetical protein
MVAPFSTTAADETEGVEAPLVSEDAADYPAQGHYSIPLVVLI